MARGPATTLAAGAGPLAAGGSSLTTGDGAPPTWAAGAGGNLAGTGLGPRRQGSGTSSTRVPQFCCPFVVWLDLGGMYSVASQASCAEESGTANE